MIDMLTNEELSNVKNSFQFIWSYISKTKIKHLFVYIMVAIGISASSFETYMIRNIVDKISDMVSSHNFDMSSVWTTLYGLIVIIVLGTVSWRVAGFIGNPLFIRLSGQIRHDMLRYLMNHDYKYFESHRPASMAWRASSSGITFTMIENILLWSIFPQTINLILSIAMLSMVNVMMTAILVIISCGVCYLLFKMALKGSPLHMEHARIESHANTQIQDVISNIFPIKSFGIAKNELNFMDNEISEEMNSKWKSVKYMEKLRLIHSIFTMIMSASMLMTIVYLWQIHKASLGDVVLVSSLGLVIINTTRDMSIALVDMSQHFSKLTETIKTIMVDHENVAPDNGFSILKGNIEFNKVSFGYHSGMNVLEDFSMKIESGSSIGLVGLSGSGKTTILRLLQKIIHPITGCITIDGIDIEQMSNDTMTHNISVVSQETGLFCRTVKENVIIGKPDATDDEIWRALDNSLCSEFVKKLPDGIDTMIGERGLKLSGGQRQRLAIARAFLKNSPILILDEATSALDNESERMIQTALGNLMKGKTVIAVAHRLSTLKDFDKILVMYEGKIIQSGTMTQLEHEDGFLKNRLII